MPEVYKDMNTYKSALSDPQSFYHSNNDTMMNGMNSPYSSSTESPSVGSMASPVSYISGRDDDNFLNFNDNSFITLSGTTVAVELGSPEIVILDQPVDKFRFRYKSEMLGTHGSLGSVNSAIRRKRHAPTVQLRGFPGIAIIRCSIVTKNEERRLPHAHHLVKREGTIETDQPYDIEVSAENNWVATFHGMGIIHTAKKHIKEELVKKMRLEALENHRRENPTISFLSVREETQIKIDAENAQKWMDLNSVALCFQAYVPDCHGIMCPITPPVYSHTINNLKSALTGELKICRIDKYVSSCDGGDEVFLLVEKVGKKNIRVKFFEIDDKDNEIWSAYGRFSELDVHHQYAIVFRTPPYRDRTITSPREVFIQLERPTDGDCSEPIKFTYKPTDTLIQRKRPRISYSENVDLNNTIPSDATMSKNIFATPTPMATSSDLSAEIQKLAFEKCDSNEYEDFLKNIEFDEYLQLVSNGHTEPFESDLCIDGGRSYDFDHSTDGPTFAINILKEALQKSKGSQTKVQKNLRKILKERTSYGDTPLHSALRYGQREIVKNILYIIGSSSQFSDLVDIQNASGKTPLHYAVVLNQPDIVRALLVLGANPNACDNHGSYILHEAVKRPDVWECVGALLDAKADIEQRDDAGWTALQLAAEAGSLRAIDLLVKAGANVNETERSYGRTALHIAAEGGHVDIARYLLEKTDIDVNLRNLGGNTALHVAVVNDGSRAQILCHLLTKHGADPHISNRISNHEREEMEIKQEPQDEEDPSLGQTSFDLASGNDEIQNLFMDIDKCKNTDMPLTCEVKEEAKDETSESSITELLDVDQLAALGELLEKNQGWKDVAKSIGCDYLSSSLEISGASPALTILSYADVQGNLTTHKLLDLLHELKQTEAATFLQDIIRNKSCSH
ncbi:hypothetical protein PV328_003329 [Microctonus aethiopoides]|uniref:RHD domain-containing protein n=1 Tax=Microctonus aethiopoides TaxID=144406 RepID=A0AA39F865_9HYME|nr:hypothetical protein PV328_003329 [Microctonus aethiopoides]